MKNCKTLMKYYQISKTYERSVLSSNGDLKHEIEKHKHLSIYSCEFIEIEGDGLLGFNVG